MSNFEHNSLRVAEKLGKRHCNVLRDIRRLPCSDNFKRMNFQQATYRDKKDRKQPMYLMTKDGLTLLVMGYTGGKRGAVKVAWINFINGRQ